MKLVSNNKIIYFTLDTKMNTKEKVDIILSPEFYWLRIFEIPVKYTSQAKKIVPNFFEDILEDDISKISYHIIKQDENKFMCFAYDNKKIFNSIKNSGIELANIHRVYFAQTECNSFKSFKINEKNFFYTDDNILVKSPYPMDESFDNINTQIQDIKLSSNFVDIKFYNKVMSLKKVISIISICILVGGINFFKAYEDNTSINKIDEKIQSLKSKNKVPSSFLQVNSIINQKQQEIKKELEKRELFFLLLNEKNFKLKSFQMKENEASFTFSSKNKKIIEFLNTNKKKISSSSLENSNLNIRIKL